MICNNIFLLIILTICMYINDLLFHFENILINDQQSKVLLVVMCGKIAFVTS